MTRPIKFRGRDSFTGKIIYGFYFEDSESTCILENARSVLVEVDPDSVAQLVGYDKDGREVYAGDTVIDEFGNDTVAALVNNLFPPVQLKEAQS